MTCAMTGAGRRRTWSLRRTGLVLALAGLVLSGVALGSQDVQAEVPSIHFSASGDYNATANTATVLDGIKTAAPDLNFALGDLSYGSSTDEEVGCDFVKRGSAMASRSS